MKTHLTASFHYSLSTLQALIILLLLNVPVTAQELEPEVRQLTIGAKTERTVRREEAVHGYAVELKRGQVLRVSIQEKGVDVTAFIIRASDQQKASDVAYELKQNRGLQSDLQSWGNGAVILRPLVAQERYRVVLITPEYQTDGKTDITAAELNKKILAFRQTLMNPSHDPIPQARELYDILIRPIERDLQNANILIWSLDGALRYLPLAALHDGNRYMAERYQQVIMTLASRTRLSDEVSNSWRGLGLGVSVQWGTFSALPAVVGELESIIRDERTTDTVKDRPVGVLPGLRLLNNEFTAQTFADALGRKFSVVHIASHFSLAPDNAEKSFLLLGDGNRLSLKTIDDAPEYAFTGVELLTLSSCNTGVNWNDAGYGPDGNEVENFGLIAQNRGAKAVIATLWSVADDSTSVLMREFSRIRSTTIGITKAEALQRAQLALLHGDLEFSGGPHSSRADLVGSPAQNPNTQSRSGRTGKPYAHPYYWAPFILIGNWR